MYLLLKWAKQGHTDVRVGLFCEDYPALRDRHLTKIAIEFPPWLGTLSENTVHGMSFILKPEFGGGIIALRNLDDASKYASSEFAAVAVDELTKNVEEVFIQFRSIMRWPGIDETRFLAGTNPGGVGHEWVHKLWIERQFPPDEPEADQFFFIQAFAKDNPHLSKMYLKQLAGLPENLRKAYLEGSWDVYEGQYFTEWRREFHVVAPLAKIPDSWRRIRAIDHGRKAPTCCLWGAIDYDGRIWWYREYYMAGVDADVNARAIAKLSGDEKYWFTVMDSACFSKTGTGETIADIYAKRENGGILAEPWPKNRQAGWSLFHEYLRLEETGVPEHPLMPKMVFYDSCVNAIRTIPKMVHDRNKPEDLDSHGEDHASDTVRGALEYLNEGKSKAPLSPMEARLKQAKERSRVSAYTLNRFYGNK